MLRRTAALVAALLLGLLTILSVVVVGMRKKSPAVLDAVRRLNHEVFNPQQMESAGTPGAFASVIRHNGRTTGDPYETPVGAVRTDDGFVIALPYGSRADWLQNVLASESAVIVDEGETYRVDRPEIVPMKTVAASFAPGDQRGHRLFGVDECLRVRRVEPADAT